MEERDEQRGDPTGVPPIETPRLRLVAATVETIEADLAGPERLAAALRATVTPEWPPGHHDAAVLRFWRGEVGRPGAAGWWLHYALLSEPVPPVLVGSVGYKGPPVDGVVEIGYSVVRSQRRRGLATEAAGALVEAAWRRGAREVLAHTLPDGAPSIGVLRKLGFERVGTTAAGELEFRLRRGR